MEVAAGGPGGESVSDTSRVRLNVVLYAVAVIGVCVLVLLTLTLVRQSDDRVDGVGVSGDAGEDVGPGVVEAVPLASSAEQARTADQIAAARSMVEAFVNFDYRDPARTVDAVRKRSTGTFLAEYSRGAADLRRLGTEAQSQMTARVVWTGLVAGDDDSATVIVATSGAVRNKTTRFRDEARNYRIQVELVRSKGAWLTSDLQYVALG